MIFWSCLLSASSSNFCPSPSWVTKFTFTQAPFLFFSYLCRWQVMQTSERTRSFLVWKLVNKETDVPRVMCLHFCWRFVSLQSGRITRRKAFSWSFKLSFACESLVTRAMKTTVGDSVSTYYTLLERETYFTFFTNKLTPCRRKFNHSSPRYMSEESGIVFFVHILEMYFTEWSHDWSERSIDDHWFFIGWKY